MRKLRANTQTRVSVGPFPSSSNGISLSTTTTAADLKATFVVDDIFGTTAPIIRMHESVLGTDSFSIVGTSPVYQFIMPSTMVGTIPGRAFLSLNPTVTSTTLPVWHEFMIEDENVFDSLVRGSTAASYLNVNVMNTVSVTATVNVGAMSAGVIGATQIAANAFTNAKFAAGALASTNFAADVGPKWADDVWDFNVTGFTANSTNAGGALIAGTATGVAGTGGGLTATETAEAVWAAASSAYGGAGSYGQLVIDIKATTNSLLTLNGSQLTAIGDTRMGLLGSIMSTSITILSTVNSLLTLNGSQLTSIGDTRLGQLATILATSNAIYGTIPTLLATSNAILSTVADIRATQITLGPTLTAVQGTVNIMATRLAGVESTVNSRASQASVDNLQTSISGGVTILTNNDHSGFKKNTQTVIPFFMAQTDHFTPATLLGSGIGVLRSIDGGAFGTCANGVTELSSGWYKITLAQSEMNGDVIGLYMTAGTAADQRNIFIKTSD